MSSTPTTAHSDIGTITGAVGVARVIAGLENATVYGMPGGYTMHIFDALYDLQDQVDVHLVRQESVGSVMAEAHGRLHGSPAVVMGQGQWVLGNAGIGIMEAHLGASPMIVLLDATDGGPSSHLGPYQASLGGYGAIDLPAAMRAITKETFVANDATQALQMTQLAIKHATSGEPGPVAVIFRRDSLFGSIDPDKQPPSYLRAPYTAARTHAVDTEQVRRAAEAIKQAKAPIIVAGNGVRLSGAEQSLLDFARGTGIPVVTTPAGKGVFGEDEPLALGVIGSFGHDRANRGVGDSDLILALGTKLGATDLADFNKDLISAARQTLVHVDVEPRNIGWTVPAEYPVVGDVGLVLAELARLLSDADVDGVGRVEALTEALPAFLPVVDDAPAMSARDAVRVMNELLPAKTIVTCDAGENRLFILRDYIARNGGTVLQPNGGGGMGYAIPAAASAAINVPDSLAVATCGDGGFAMSLHSLISAVDVGADMIVVVFDNGVLGWVYHGQRGRVIASELPETDLAAIARAAGCSAHVVASVEGFRTELAKAVQESGVRVIIAKCSVDDRYQDVMASLHAVDGYAVPQR